MKRATEELDVSEIEVPQRPIPELDKDEEEAFEELVQAFRAELEHPEDFVRGRRSRPTFWTSSFGRTSSRATGAT